MIVAYSGDEVRYRREERVIGFEPTTFALATSQSLAAHRRSGFDGLLKALQTGVEPGSFTKAMQIEAR